MITDVLLLVIGGLLVVLVVREILLVLGLTRWPVDRDVD